MFARLWTSRVVPPKNDFNLPVLKKEEAGLEKPSKIFLEKYVKIKCEVIDLDRLISKISSATNEEKVWEKFINFHWIYWIRLKVFIVQFLSLKLKAFFYGSLFVSAYAIKVPEMKMFDGDKLFVKLNIQSMLCKSLVVLLSIYSIYTT